MPSFVLTMWLCPNDAACIHTSLLGRLHHMVFGVMQNGWKLTSGGREGTCEGAAKGGGYALG